MKLRKRTTHSHRFEPEKMQEILLDEESDEKLIELTDLKNPCVQYLFSYEGEDAIRALEYTKISKKHWK
jgi:hypothetical protein